MMEDVAKVRFETLQEQGQKLYLENKFLSGENAGLRERVAKLELQIIKPLKVYRLEAWIRELEGQLEALRKECRDVARECFGAMEGAGMPEFENYADWHARLLSAASGLDPTPAVPPVQEHGLEKKPGSPEGIQPTPSASGVSESGGTGQGPGLRDPLRD